MRHPLSRSAVVVLVATSTACVGEMPPPPQITVTSPERGLVQGHAGQVVVKGVASPGVSGSPVTSVTVNRVPAMLAADGSFTAVVDVPPGAMLLETSAFSAEGGSVTDARAVQVGELRPVGTTIERAATAALSTDAFARLSAVAGPKVKSMDLMAKLAPLQPMANLGDDLANVKVSITKLTFGDVKISLAPVDGGLEFSATIDALNVAANAAYGGALVPDGTSSVGVTADRVTLAGTLVVTPAGTDGFSTAIASPTVRATSLRLQASGLAGKILDLLQDNLESTVQRVLTSSAEKALQPLINSAFGALAGPKRIDVLGKTLELQASPSAVQFTRTGALVTMNLGVKIAGSESSPGFVFTPNGTPSIDMNTGVQVGLADDLINELLAEVHALGLLDLHLEEDFGLFDTADIKLTVPPMVSANNSDGTMRLVLGDMIATFSEEGKTVISAALNAQVDLALLRGNTPEQIALKFGKVHAFVNVLDDETGMLGSDLSGAAAAGIGIQLDSLSQFLVTVPVPSVAGVTLDNLSLRADSGYVIASGSVH
ncbi:MAG: hypothetical protein HOV81_45350 [Kofleriaceae bacterium]|nr:hypothetical protein [Kofleriaceae bacterium]